MKSRIPWWPELLDKKKDHNVGIESTEEEHHGDETNEDMEKVPRRQETDENDVFYNSVRDLEDLDSIHDGKETTTDIAMSNKDDEDEFHGLEKEMVESMEALDNGKDFHGKITDDIYYDPVTCIKDISKSSDMIGIDNNASDSGIDEDEEYHDSLEDIGTTLGSEDSISEAANSVNVPIAAPANNQISPGDGEYWDPVIDTYKKKKNSNRVPNENGEEEDTHEEHKFDLGIETSPALGGDSDPLEYWDPTSDSYKRKRSNRNASDKDEERRISEPIPDSSSK